MSRGADESEALDRFVEAARSIVSPAIREWKDRGGKVVGYFCSMVPEELFMAAGLLLHAEPG